MTYFHIRDQEMSMFGAVCSSYVSEFRLHLMQHIGHDLKGMRLELISGLDSGTHTFHIRMYHLLRMQILEA